ncbi:MAG: hypothetical protein ACPLYC_00520, partial [Minisyncoccia bacterium]
GRAFYQLKKGGYIIKRKIAGEDKYFLSAKALEKILKLKIQRKMRQKVGQLKGKYLVVIFDIPEEIRFLRDRFRESLKNLKFEKLQQSVWVTSLNFLPEVYSLIKLYKLEKYVKLMLAEKLDRELIKKFIQNI